jgi:hypothetical protein
MTTFQGDSLAECQSLGSNYCLQLIELKKLDDFAFRWRIPLGNPRKPHWNDDYTVSGM